MNDVRTEFRKPKLLVYYFSFPHYRRAILMELANMAEVEIDLYSGVVGRGGVKPLTRADIGELRLLESLVLGNFTYEREIVRRAVSSEYDAVVVAPALSSLSTWAIVALRFVLRRNTYLWGDCGHLDGWIRPRLQEIMNRMSTGLLVYGRASAKGAKRFGTPADKIKIVGNAFESNADRWGAEDSVGAYRLMKERARLATEDGRIVLVHAGRLTRDKCPEVLLNALTPLRRRYSDVRLHILGDGPLLDRLVAHENSDLVEFHGAVYDQVTRDDLLSKATLVVAPYVMGLLAVDALRAGVPVLYPDNPLSGSEVEALTVGVNSVAFEPGNPRAVARAVDEWIALSGKVQESAFVEARQHALKGWDPSTVANAILREVLTADSQSG